MSELEHKEDLEDLTAELKRHEMAYGFMAQQLAQVIQDKTIMGAALNTATVLIDQLLSDLRVAGGEPSPGLIAAYNKFREMMQRVLGKQDE